MAHRMSTVGRGDRPCGTGFREDVDWRSGSIRVAGRLTGHGAELVGDAVESLRRSGHALITVDLHAVPVADDDALAELHSLARRLRAHRGRLVILSDEGN